MSLELVVPKVGESIAEVEVVQWLKAEGDAVALDETIVILDTAKTTVELPSPVAGTLGKILKQAGEGAVIGEALALIEEGAGAVAAPQAPATPPEEHFIAPLTPESTAPAPEPIGNNGSNGSAEHSGFVMPAAGRVLAQNNLQAQDVPASGPSGRLLKEDVTRHLQGMAAQPEAKTATVEGTPHLSTIEQPAPPQPDGRQAQPIADPPTAPPTPAPQAIQPAPQAAPQAAPPPVAAKPEAEAGEEVVRMSLLRREIARRLVEAQQTAALLTTFNEVDMAPVMALRKEHQETFQKKYGIKLGFMSFFAKATIDALKQFPAINAEIRGSDIVYRNYFDIGVAIGSGKGLVVPILRRAELLSFAQIEQGIADFAKRAKDGALKPDELEGGTFTITNGGIYGSLLSTPIVNPPQSGILGMHTIQERPVARNGEVVIRPMMYVALTYDHRIVDGREAVSFLVRVKECIENPARMLLEV